MSLFYPLQTLLRVYSAVNWVGGCRWFCPGTTVLRARYRVRARANLLGGEMENRIRNIHICTDVNGTFEMYVVLYPHLGSSRHCRLVPVHILSVKFIGNR